MTADSSTEIPDRSGRAMSAALTGHGRTAPRAVVTGDEVLEACCLDCR